MYSIYIIKEGDTIDSIADKFNTTTQVLYDLNTFIPNTELEAGRRIIVPSTNIKIFDSYVVKKGDNLYSISKMYNTTSNVIANLNGLKDGEYIYENEILLVPTNDVDVYVTNEGDTLDTAIKKLGSNLSSIYDQNKNIYLLPDQLLVSKKV